MRRTFGIALFFSLIVVVRGQEVFIARDASTPAPKIQPTIPPEAPVLKAVAVQPPVAEPAPPASGPVVSAAKTASNNQAIVAKKPLSAPAPTSAQNRSVRKETPFMTRAADSRTMAIGGRPVDDKTPRHETASSRPAPNSVATPAPALSPKKVEVVTAAPSKKAEVAEATPAPSKKAEVAEATPAPPKKVEVAAAAPVPSPKKVETAAVPKKNENLAAAAAPQKKDSSVAMATAKVQSRDEGTGPRVSLAAAPQPISFSGDTAFVKLANGFDFPIGKPDAQGYYKARGFRSHGHLGEDWDGVGGGDTDLGDSIYCIGDGVVVFARDCHMGWGNVVIVRHSYREGGSVRSIDSLYGHLQSILVHRGQSVARGQKIATMGNAHGLYDAHLHLEIRKNLEIGMSRAAFARDFSNYYDPTQFINSHRSLQTGNGTYRVALNTFTHDARINWEKARNYSHARTGGGTGESSAALKRAVAASKH